MKNKRGRPFLYDDKMIQKTITLPPQIWEVISVAGSGNHSKGIRIILKLLTEQYEKGEDNERKWQAIFDGIKPGEN